MNAFFAQFRFLFHEKCDYVVREEMCLCAAESTNVLNGCLAATIVVVVWALDECQLLFVVVYFCLF